MEGKWCFPAVDGRVRGEAAPPPPAGLGLPGPAWLRPAGAGSSRRGGGGCRSQTAPSPAPPAAATSPLQLAARLFCLIKLNVSVNFPPGRAALPLPEPACWLQMSTRPVGAASSPWRRAAPATRGCGRRLLAGAVGRGLRDRGGAGAGLPRYPPSPRDSVLHGRALL